MRSYLSSLLLGAFLIGLGVVSTSHAHAATIWVPSTGIVVVDVTITATGERARLCFTDAAYIQVRSELQNLRQAGVLTYEISISVNPQGCNGGIIG